MLEIYFCAHLLYYYNIYYYILCYFYVSVWSLTTCEGLQKDYFYTVFFQRFKLILSHHTWFLKYHLSNYSTTHRLLRVMIHTMVNPPILGCALSSQIKGYCKRSPDSSLIKSIGQLDRDCASEHGGENGLLSNVKNSKTVVLSAFFSHIQWSLIWPHPSCIHIDFDLSADML